MPGVRLVRYSLNSVDVSATHPFARRFDVECYRAEQVLYSLTSLVSSGFIPDVIVAHPGWGETLPLRTIFPHARILLYCEFFYGTQGRDVGFDPEFPQTGADGNVSAPFEERRNAARAERVRCRTISNALAALDLSRKYISRMIRVIHEGVDTDVVRPAGGRSVPPEFGPQRCGARTKL